ncbi:hypothetical protein MMH89_04770 [Candidatus Comchoanobacter bicostacola]|uniref:Uncharacterized protein n=1 Tax=Candidatus Comchoanobacter bicostacola TaxID=2919598 RepID=A0ABY5DIY3_9GAMM|nr:hypothetical protein [Candidatus Comchoanobacter bicostacola]UTC24528.1 hypothetical protein MMH89_04770 [Candidatus Comchoanobacter bicostacola]
MSQKPHTFAPSCLKTNLAQQTISLFKHAWSLVTTDSTMHLYRHFGKYNSLNTHADSISYRAADLFGCLFTQVMGQGFGREIIFRGALCLTAATSVFLSSLHFLFQLVYYTCHAAISLSVNSVELIIKQMLTNIILLRIPTNTLALVTAILCSPISKTARTQAAHAAKSLYYNLSSVLIAIIASPALLLGHYKCTPKTTELASHESLLVTKTEKKEKALFKTINRRVSQTLYASAPYVKKNFKHMIENIAFIFKSPFASVLSLCLSAFILSRALVRVAFSPLSIALPPIQKAIFGENPNDRSKLNPISALWDTNIPSSNKPPKKPS